ncbi:hypothetical protein MSAN_01524000 [Mycena sanguinolenta]|uniref:Uncharacterized protein n=1 Tax=Mycena sanguinolenta TaxID=230812 RepID=A0A8H6Y709_9AGAR|nr:hypothetical protein MSAN_01524000 [Mycena sanguinolenta]
MLIRDISDIRLYKLAQSYPLPILLCPHRTSLAGNKPAPNPPPHSCSLPLMSTAEEIIAPGDFVAVSHGAYGRREGLVVGSHIDYAVRHIPLHFSFRFAYAANALTHPRVARSSKCNWTLARRTMHGTPTVTRVRRTISYPRPSLNKARTIERRVYW